MTGLPGAAGAYLETLIGFERPAPVLPHLDQVTTITVTPTAS